MNHYREVPVTERLPDKEGRYTVVRFGEHIICDCRQFKNGKFVFTIPNGMAWPGQKDFLWLEPFDLKELIKEEVEKAWSECETWKGWVTQTELDEKKQQYINQLNF